MISAATMLKRVIQKRWNERCLSSRSRREYLRAMWRTKSFLCLWAVCVRFLYVVEGDADVEGDTDAKGDADAEGDADAINRVPTLHAINCGVFMWESGLSG